jgi:diacylglycerol kinase family enzyme
MTTIGIDAAVVHELSKTRKGPITKGSYLQPAWNALWNFKQPAMTVEVDGVRVVEDQRVFTFIANVREYGAGFPIANEAVSNDGLLDICIFPADSQLNLLQMSLASLVTLPTFFPGSMYLRGREIRVTSTEPAPVQIDGDAGGFTPLKISLLPFRVPFIVP